VGQESIYIIDDHEVFLIGIKTILQKNGISDLRTFTSGDDFCLQVIQNKPSMVIVDQMLELNTGIELILRIKAVHGENLKTILISSIKDPSIKELCVKYGIHGYIDKSEKEEKIFAAIRTILNGGTYYSSDSKIEKNLYKVLDKANPFSKLTKRELEVARLLAKGLPHREIGNLLRIQEKTVQYFSANITSKLGQNTVRQLARQAYIWGILKDDSFE
jgi:two-component system, NarL family, invasion response regulator UvrY